MKKEYKIVGSKNFTEKELIEYASIHIKKFLSKLNNHNGKNTNFYKKIKKIYGKNRIEYILSGKDIIKEKEKTYTIHKISDKLYYMGINTKFKYDWEEEVIDENTLKIIYKKI